MAYEVAPSKIKQDELIDVASCIIDAHPGISLPPREKLTAVFSKEYQPDSQQPDLTKYDETLKTTTDLINTHRKQTFKLADEEAAGYTILGKYAVCFSQILSDELSRLVMYWNQMVAAKRGQNPTADTAIIMLLESSGSLGAETIPVVVYEYKPVVDPQFEMLNEKDLVEALLQASYCLRYYKISQMIHCLTDLRRWHYFKVKTSSDNMMNIEWWHLIDHTFPLSVDIFTKHAGFIINEVKKLVNH